MRFAFKTSPQNTTWPELLSVWAAADDTDVFESGFTFDHFYPVTGGPSTGPCLEGWTTLTALAQATKRLRLGTMVKARSARTHPSRSPAKAKNGPCAWSPATRNGGTSATART